MLVVTDSALVVLHIAAAVRGSQTPLYFIDTDRSYAEFWQYVKLLHVAVLLSTCAVAFRSWQVALWLPVVAYLLLDDSLQIHETVGAAVAQRLDLPEVAGLRSQDAGEVAVSLTAGTLLGAPLAVGYLLGTPASKWVYRRLVVLLAVVAFFGVVVDLAHVAVRPWITNFDWVAVLEDGGEMVAVSLLVVFSFYVNLAGQHAAERSPGPA